VAIMLLHLEVDDYDAWKPLFDSDPAGRKQSATGHMISRDVDNPNAIFIRTEFPSADEAKAFQDRADRSRGRGERHLLTRSDRRGWDRTSDLSRVNSARRWLGVAMSG